MSYYYDDAVASGIGFGIGFGYIVFIKTKGEYPCL